MKILGVEVTIFAGPDMESKTIIEDEDAKELRDRYRYDYTEYENLNHETGEKMTEWTYGVHNRKHHFWQRQ